MHQGSWKFLKNATSNLVTGGASALLAIGLPHYFVHYFRPAEFSLWVLVLQVAAYVNFLNLGIQTAVGRYVAHALGRNDLHHAEQIVGAGLQILTALAGIAILALVAIGVLFPYIFRGIDPALIGTARQVLFWTGGAMAIGLPASVFLGVFIGLQRNEVPAIAAFLWKGTLALALIWVGEQTHSLIIAAQVYFAVSMAGYVLQYAWFKGTCCNWRIQPFAIPVAARRELISYCASLTAWSMGMFLVTGLDTTVVGIFDFKNVAAYGISAGAVALFTGFLTAAMNPLLQIFAKLHARNRPDAMLGLLDFTSWTVAFLALATGCWLVLPSRVLFRLWVGSGMAAIGIPVFAVLVLANSIRMLAAPYANYLVAAGLQRKVYLSPFAEGVTNLAVSIVAARHFGAIGVAWGTVAGAIVGIAANYLYNFTRTLPPWFSMGKMFASNIGYPLLAVSPMICILVMGTDSHAALAWSVPAIVIAGVPGALETMRRYRQVTAVLSRRDDESSLFAPVDLSNLPL